MYPPIQSPNPNLLQGIHATKCRKISQVFLWRCMTCSHGVGTEAKSTQTKANSRPGSDAATGRGWSMAEYSDTNRKQLKLWCYVSICWNDNLSEKIESMKGWIWNAITVLFMFLRPNQLHMPGILASIKQTYWYNRLSSFWSNDKEISMTRQSLSHKNFSITRNQNKLGLP